MLDHSLIMENCIRTSDVRNTAFRLFVQVRSSALPVIGIRGNHDRPRPNHSTGQLFSYARTAVLRNTLSCPLFLENPHAPVDSPEFSRLLQSVQLILRQTLGPRLSGTMLLLTAEQSSVQRSTCRRTSLHKGYPLSGY